VTISSTTHTCWKVGKAVEEAKAPRTQPVAQNGYSKQVPVASAIVLNIGRCHGPGGLYRELLISPMKRRGGLKPTLGWSSTITLFSRNVRLSSVALKRVSWALPRVDRAGYLDFGSERARLNGSCVHDGGACTPHVIRSEQCQLHKHDIGDTRCPPTRGLSSLIMSGSESAHGPRRSQRERKQVHHFTSGPSSHVLLHMFYPLTYNSGRPRSLSEEEAR
jgi:hypothetical protein